MMVALGASGDAYTVAVNPIRDTIFGGNQTLYSIAESATIMGAGAVTAYNNPGLLQEEGIKPPNPNVTALEELTDAQLKNVKTVDNIIKNNLTESDFSGVLSELQGKPIPKPGGGYFDHITEMKQSYVGLQKAVNSLTGSLSNPNLTPAAKNILQNSLDKALNNIKRIANLFAPYGGIK